jgi:hypothetical protein
VNASSVCGARAAPLCVCARALCARHAMLLSPSPAHARLHTCPIEAPVFTHTADLMPRTHARTPPCSSSSSSRPRWRSSTRWRASRHSTSAQRDVVSLSVCVEGDYKAKQTHARLGDGLDVLSCSAAAAAAVAGHLEPGLAVSRQLGRLSVHMRDRSKRQLQVPVRRKEYARAAPGCSCGYAFFVVSRLLV